MSLTSHLRIGEIQRIHPWWHWLFPIQSGEHFAWLCIFALTSLLVTGVVTGWETDTSLAVTVGGVAGSLPAFSSNLKATMTVEWDLDVFDPLPLINRCLLQAGWTPTEKPEKVRVYIQRLPRWLRWRSGEITIRSTATNLLVVTGPIGGLHIFRNKLTESTSGKINA